MWAIDQTLPRSGKGSGINAGVASVNSVEYNGLLHSLSSATRFVNGGCGYMALEGVATR